MLEDDDDEDVALVVALVGLLCSNCLVVVDCVENLQRWNLSINVKT